MHSITKCSEEKLFALITSDASKLPKYVPQMIHNVQVLHEDSEVRVGSVYVWDYVQEGKPSALREKEKITTVDHKNMSLSFTVFEGDHLTNYYNNFSTNEDVPDPTYINERVEDFTKELDTNSLKEE
ncbi:hypothetical protein MKX03_011204 [Papaver bracteatum]|nr:hypothetical protein MKX03_011204 [Papaver bracteatum]